MEPMKLLAILLCLSIKVYQASGDCDLDPNYIKSSSQVYLLKDVKGKFELLLRDSVPTGQTLYLSCGSQIDSVHCNATNNFESALPSPNCKRQSAVVKQMTSHSEYNTYSIGYNVENQFVELYSSVYSASKVSAMFSIHKSYTNNIATPRPDQTFTTDRIISGSAAESFSNRNIFEYFKKEFGMGQPYIHNDKDSVIQRGHLTPSNDFLFDLDMRATFKYINVVPQFASINHGKNWRRIEDWARQSPVKGHEPYRVLTGGHDVLELSNPSKNNTMTEVYLLKGTQNPVPKWTYKIIEKQNHCTVFVTYNNIYANVKPTKICTAIPCPIQLYDNLKIGYTYCCDINEFKMKIMPTVNFC